MAYEETCGCSFSEKRGNTWWYCNCTKSVPQYGQVCKDCLSGTHRMVKD